MTIPVSDCMYCKNQMNHATKTAAEIFTKKLFSRIIHLPRKNMLNEHISESRIKGTKMEAWRRSRTGFFGWIIPLATRMVTTELIKTAITNASSNCSNICLLNGWLVPMTSGSRSKGNFIFKSIHAAWESGDQVIPTRWSTTIPIKIPIAGRARNNRHFGLKFNSNKSLKNDANENSFHLPL